MKGVSYVYTYIHVRKCLTHCSSIDRYIHRLNIRHMCNLLFLVFSYYESLHGNEYFV